MADLQRVLFRGVGTNEIVASLGKPDRIEILGEEKVEWRFSLTPFPAGKQMAEETYVDGLILAITNGHLADWGCAYVRRPPKRTQETLFPDRGERATQTPAQDLPRLNLFVVSSDPIDGGRFIDTQLFPKLGYISPTPDLSISELREVTFEQRIASGPGNQGGTNWAFGIFLTRKDAAQLESLTARNVSRKLLIMAGDEAVSAPKILEPLGTGSLVIECSERSLMDTIKKHLARIQRRIE
jgi:hypothetical protein